MAEKLAQKNVVLLILIIFLAVAVLLLALSAAILIPIYAKLPSSTSSTDPVEPTLPPPPASLYGEGDFALDEQGYLTCLAGKSRLGIDVSGHQGQIDWQQVKEAGVEFVFIRIGGRGWGEEGTLYADNWAQEYYQGAKAAGLEVGAYFFSQATSPWEAIEEAVFVLPLIAGWELDLPVVYDWEQPNGEARTNGVSEDTLMDCTVAFCEMIRAAGHEPMIYFNQNQAKHLMRLEELTQYPFWLAMYQETYTYPYKVDFWQYSCTGTVPGISTNVDLNLQFIYE